MMKGCFFSSLAFKRRAQEYDLTLFTIKRLIFSAVAFSLIDDNIEASFVILIADFKFQGMGL